MPALLKLALGFGLGVFQVGLTQFLRSVMP
jgi:hypothetical protein